MAKGSRKTKPATTAENKPNTLMPLLNAAFFCERVIQEKDNVLTPYRIIDSLTITPPLDDNILSQIKAINTDKVILPLAHIQFFMVLKSGDAMGERVIRLDTINPSGEKVKGVENVVNFLGGEASLYSYGPFAVRFKTEGLYWYDLKINDKLLTRVPLRIVFETPKRVNQLAEKEIRQLEEKS
jgi:hypothetical protein